ncbi:multidrug effflux MFS transporter [Microbacterium sp. E-13]|uniref:multidrug effflux MFS transporter n=1 Tax=Microbacterium sp. E-13 TaxID=3404048 RepID=UPI003CF36591
MRDNRGTRGTDASTAGLATPQLLTLALLAAISPLATAMYLPALPAMAAELGTDAPTLQLTVTAFMVGLAVGQVVLGPLSDRVGRRPVLLVGTSVCVVASLACALAPGIHLLIAARLVQGLAGAAGIVLGRAIVADTVHGEAAARAFSLLMAIGAIAPVVAPLLGGPLAESSGWRGVFAALTGLAALMLLAAIVLLPETLPAGRRRAREAASGRNEAWAIVRRPRFIGYTVVLVFAYATLIAYVAASPFVLQEGFGLAPGAFALAFAANAVGLTLASFTSARLVRRIPPRRLLAAGITAEAAAVLVLLGAALARTLTAPLLLVLLWLSVACLGFVMGNATSLAMDEAGRGAGSASALLGASQFGLAALAAPVATSGTIGSPVAMTVTMAACVSIAAIAVVVAGRGDSGNR